MSNGAGIMSSILRMAAPCDWAWDKFAEPCTTC